ncbi:hypothetical protein BKI52_18830 [marine bacterium AO1-C]|nr:hypothetical protein BKI52_18830 [marine bacterium AO1-C]
MKTKIKHFILPFSVLLILIFLYAFTSIRPHRILTTELRVHDGVFQSNISEEVYNNYLVVNIGQLDRNQLAQLIDKISQASPKAIAAFICFDKAKTTPHDSLLASMLQKHRDKIALHNAPSEGCIHYEGIVAKTSAVKTNEPYFRRWEPSKNGLERYLGQIVDTQKVAALSQLSAQPLINYQLSFENVRMIDGKLLLNYDISSELFTRKIVYLGYLGDTISSDTQKLSPYSYPLMASLNVLHNILTGNHLQEAGLWLSVVVTLALVLFNMLIGYLVRRTPAAIYFTLALMFSFSTIFASIAIMFYWHLSYGLVVYLSYTWAWVLVGYVVVWSVRR